MKTLQIQQSAQFDRASRQMVPVINPSEKACLSIGIVAVVALFASLGLMWVPGIVASGLTALLAVSFAPSISTKGGEA